MKGQDPRTKEGISIAMTKNHTTMLAGVTMAGEWLAPVVNWLAAYNPKKKGNVAKKARTEPTTKAAPATKAAAESKKGRRRAVPVPVPTSTIPVRDDELTISPHRKAEHPLVKQFVQTGTHWTTGVSFENYISVVVWPHVEKRRKERIARDIFEQKVTDPQRLAEIRNHWESKKRLLVVDCAPIHVSTAVRNNFEKNWAHRGGVLVFVPPSCTDQLQPLDISVFGPFKSALRAIHTEITTKQRYEFDPPATRLRRYKHASREARAILLDAINGAIERVSRNTILSGWVKALGGTVAEAKGSASPISRSANYAAEVPIAVMRTDAIRLALCNFAALGKYKWELDYTKRREWFARVKKDKSLMAPKEMAALPYMFFYGTVGDGIFERNAYWYEAVMDELEDPLCDRHWKAYEEARYAYEGAKALTAHELLQRDLGDFADLFAELNHQQALMEEAGRLNDDESESECDDDPEDPDDEAAEDEENEANDDDEGNDDDYNDDNDDNDTYDNENNDDNDDEEAR